MKLYCPECETRYEGDEYEICPDDGARLFRLDSPDEEGDPLIGAVIEDRFRIEDLVGTGGMGAVYRGIQLSVQREVAIKVLRPELVDREVMLERFFREAKVVSEMSHPNIVRLVDFGQDQDRDLLYLAMELVEGTDLGDLLRDGRLRTNLALEVVYQICGALTEPHARGIVHRDLKPENLVMMPISDGTLQVKVLDFGIARALEGGTKLTKTGMICGTPSYMSPEQAQNEEIDGRTDLYALGVLLFEMLTGSPPFVGETSLQVLLCHIQRPAPNLATAVPAGTVPDEVSELVGRLLAKQPGDRPRSAREVRDEIDELRRQLQLRPVRLETDETDFAPWVLPRLEIRSNSGDDDDGGPADGDLPIGFNDVSTGEVGAAGGETGDFEERATEVYESGETEPEYIGAADTLAAGGEALRSSQPEARAPSPSDSAPQVVDPDGDDGPVGTAQRTQVASHTTEVTQAGEVSQPSVEETAPQREFGADDGASKLLANPVVLGLGALMLVLLGVVAGVVTIQVLSDGDEPQDETATEVAEASEAVGDEVDEERSEPGETGGDEDEKQDVDEEDEPVESDEERDAADDEPDDDIADDDDDGPTGVAGGPSTADRGSRSPMDDSESDEVEDSEEAQEDPAPRPTPEPTQERPPAPEPSPEPEDDDPADDDPPADDADEEDVAADDDDDDGALRDRLDQLRGE